MTLRASPTGDRSLRSAWFVVQAVATIGWWAAVSASSSVRDAFELTAANRDALNAFIAGDLVVMVAGSLATAYGIVRGAAWAGKVAALVTGGALYATLYLVAWTAMGGDGWVGVVLMSAATAIDAAITARL